MARRNISAHEPALPTRQSLHQGGGRGASGRAFERNGLATRASPTRPSVGRPGPPLFRPGTASIAHKCATSAEMGAGTSVATHVSMRRRWPLFLLLLFAATKAVGCATGVSDQGFATSLVTSIGDGGLPGEASGETDAEAEGAPALPDSGLEATCAISEAGDEGDAALAAEAGPPSAEAGEEADVACEDPLAPGDLVIDELMIASVAGSGDYGEWVEVRSTRPCALNLHGRTASARAASECGRST